MASKSKFQAIRGTRDLLPPDTALWNRVEQTAHEVFGTYGFGEIRVPIFELKELFARSIGADTDVVSKEMYTFDTNKQLLDDYLALSPQEQAISALFDIPPSEASQFAAQREKPKPIPEVVTLRPEATASVCRAYIEHNMQQLPQPVKLYYMGPMFRRERPQKGRYRQFYQIGAEILGGPDAPAIDAELIEMLMTFFDKCGLQGTELSINSIGHAADNCRRG
ncbi:MAG: ATP phosphoribosyltransferase regulatory subunit, partial [Candidatus Acidiferrum sp.]